MHRREVQRTHAGQRGSSRDRSPIEISFRRAGDPPTLNPEGRRLRSAGAFVTIVTAAFVGRERSCASMLAHERPNFAQDNELAGVIIRRLEWFESLPSHFLTPALPTDYSFL